MITNFEDLTQELNDDERNLIEFLIAGFKVHTESTPIKEPEICKKLNDYLAKKGLKIRITGVRLRKLVNFIRANALLPLIATSRGYFVSYDVAVIDRQILSLEQRARSIQSSADGLKKYSCYAQR